MSEDEERLLRAIWLSRSVANYSRPKYMKGLIERFRLRKKKGEEGEERTTTTIVHDDFNKKSSDDDDDEKEHEDIVAFQEILQPSQLLKRGKFLDEKPEKTQRERERDRRRTRYSSLYYIKLKSCKLVLYHYCVNAKCCYR